MAELLLRLTEKPFAPAGPVRVTVPVDVAPPRILVGLKATEPTCTGRTESDSPIELELRVAVILAVSFDEVGCVATANVAEDAPPAITTESGTWTLL